MDTGCHAHWLPIITVEGCFGAREQDMKILLALKQAKTGQLDKQYNCVLDNASVLSDGPKTESKFRSLFYYLTHFRGFLQNGRQRSAAHH
jgi:hypothetical protein